MNGTGQRKLYPSTTTPTVISSTHPLLLHDTPSNISEKQDFDDIINDVSISKFTDKDLNNTLAEHNITNETITVSILNLSLYFRCTNISDFSVRALQKFFQIKQKRFQISMNFFIQF